MLPTGAGDIDLALKLLKNRVYGTDSNPHWESRRPPDDTEQVSSNVDELNASPTPRAGSRPHYFNPLDFDHWLVGMRWVPGDPPIDAIDEQVKTLQYRLSDQNL